MRNTLVDRVRISVGAMGDDEFERFMSELLPRIYPGFDSIEPSYNFMGKTTKGKCDAYAYHSSDDAYTAIICTTKQSDVRTKILDDIEKLTSTKFFKKIKHVLLCLNTPIKDEIEDYRAACDAHGWKLDSLSLERITNHAVGQEDLMLGYFGESTPRVEEPSDSNRRFDCGKRVKDARNDISLAVSVLIEKIDFPSEREWVAIESGEIEIAERYINALSRLTGISGSWLKHEVGAKYPSETLYYSRFTPIETIASEGILASFVAIEPSSMNAFVLVQQSEHRWQVLPFSFSMNFWEWIDDHHHIKDIWELLKKVNQAFKHPYGRIITPKVMNDLRAEKSHPAKILKETGPMSYWFDDLFDVHHKFPVSSGYSSYGDWFVKLQTYFRNCKEQSADEEHVRII